MYLNLDKPFYYLSDKKNVSMTKSCCHTLRLRFYLIFLLITHIQKRNILSLLLTNKDNEIIIKADKPQIF